MTIDENASPALVIERFFDAPVELIWQMWTRPEHVKSWYGPEGAAIPVAKLDVLVGGTRFVCIEMPSPEGPMRMWFTGEYKEVVNNQRLVYTESIADEHGNIPPTSDAPAPGSHPITTEVRVELHDLGGRTKMVLTHVGIPQDSPGAIGWAMALDKLAAQAESPDRPIAPNSISVPGIPLRPVDPGSRDLNNRPAGLRLQLREPSMPSRTSIGPLTAGNPPGPDRPVLHSSTVRPGLAKAGRRGRACVGGVSQTDAGVFAREAQCDHPGPRATGAQPANAGRARRP